nr:MAG TPA: hypothetical protein [Caudoviricetes sp.]
MASSTADKLEAVQLLTLFEVVHWQETKLKHSLRLIIGRGGGKPLLVMQKIRRFYNGNS